MHSHMKPLLGCMAVAAIGCTTAQAAITFDSFNDNQTDADFSFTPSATSNAYLIVALAGDNGGSATNAVVQFGGMNLTPLSVDARVGIFGMAITSDLGTQNLFWDFTSGGTSGNQIVTYGTLSGVNTSATLKTAEGVASTDETNYIVTGESVAGVTSTDYVLSVLNVNGGSGTNDTGATFSAGLSQLGFVSLPQTTTLTATTLGGVTGATGSYAASADYVSSNTWNSAANSYGATVAFTEAGAIPEPSSFALVLGTLGLLGLRRRR